MMCNHKTFLRKRNMRNGNQHIGHWCSECNKFVSRNGGYWVSKQNLNAQQLSEIDDYEPIGDGINC